MAELIELVKVLAWPVVVASIFIYLRKSLNSLITRLSSLTLPGGVAIGTNSQPKDLPAAHENVLTPNTTIYLESLIDNSKTSTEPNALALVKQKIAYYNPETISEVTSWINKEVPPGELMTPNERINLLTDYAKILYLNLVYERIYENIFGTQISLLLHLNSFITDIQENLSRYYEESVRRCKALNVNANPYKTYLMYLIKNNLVIRDDRFRITIQPFGRDFIRYLTDMGKPLEKQL